MRGWGVRATLIALVAVLGVGAVVLAASSSPEAFSSRAGSSDGRSCGGILGLMPPKHPVTPNQLAASNAVVQRVIDDLVVTDAEGRSLDWPALSEGRPVVIVFIKVGCPCSVEFEPYFHRLAEAYRGAVRFVGIIDGDGARARRYAETNSVPYPIIADPETRLIGRFDAKNGGYAALLRPEGIVAGFWPGFSRDAMADLGRRIAGLVSVAEHAIDTRGLPVKLTTGCPFDLPPVDRASDGIAGR
jgi:hypothetical protein